MMKPKRGSCWRFVLSAWLLISGAAYAQSGGGEIGTELKELPQRVKFEPGKVSLFADYENAVRGKFYVSDPFGEAGPSEIEVRILVPIYFLR